MSTAGIAHRKPRAARSSSLVELSVLRAIHRHWLAYGEAPRLRDVVDLVASEGPAVPRETVQTRVTRLRDRQLLRGLRLTPAGLAEIGAVT